MNEASLPTPTGDPETARRDLGEHGICLVEGALPPERLERARRRLYEAADEDLAAGRGHRIEVPGVDFDDTNQRVWTLLNKGDVFVELVEDPIALDLVRHVLGWPALLSNVTANITGPGGGDMRIHCDELVNGVPAPFQTPVGVNVMWLLDDFREENGATRIVPGSHGFGRYPTPEDQTIETVPLEAPAGTAVGLDGRLWHRTGTNRSENQRRAAIFSWYVAPFLRTQENWFLSLSPLVLETASTELLELLGYRSEGLGTVHGHSPR